MDKEVNKQNLINVMGVDDYYGADGLISDTVESAIEDVFDGSEIDEAVNNEIDRTLIYNDDIWKLLMYYENPTSVNYDKMVESFYDDVYGYVSDYIDQFGSEDEDEE